MFIVALFPDKDYHEVMGLYLENEHFRIPNQNMDKQLWLEQLAQYVCTDKGRRLFIGYGGAYAYHSLGYAEVSASILHGQYPEPNNTVIGLTNHCMGNVFWAVTVNPIGLVGYNLMTNPLERRCFVDAGTEEAFPIDLVHADVLPSTLPGDVLLLQIIAFPHSLEFFDDLKDGMRPGRITPADADGSSVLVCGEVVGSEELPIEGGIFGKGFFRRTTIKTDAGLLPLVHTDEMARGNGRFVLSRCTISGDAAIGEYQEGALFTTRHFLRVLADVFATDWFSRLSMILSSDCTYLSRGAMRAKGAGEVVKTMEQIRANEFAEGQKTFAFPATLTESDDPKHPAGTECLALSALKKNVPSQQRLFNGLVFITTGNQHIITVETIADPAMHFRIHDPAGWEPLVIHNDKSAWQAIIKRWEQKDVAATYMGMEATCTSRYGESRKKGKETAFQLLNLIMNMVREHGCVFSQGLTFRDGSACYKLDITVSEEGTITDVTLEKT